MGPTGRRQQVTENNGRSVSYVYDDLYRLTRETINDPTLGTIVNDYIVDPVGNRTFSTEAGVSTAYSVDANDRLVSAGGKTYSYNGNGNLLTTSVDSTVITNTYDARDKLIQSQTEVAAVVTDTTSFTYDVDGNRVTRNHNGTATQYVVDRNQQFAQVLNELDGTGALQTSYVYGDDLIKQRRAANDSYYHYDGLGSTRALSNTAAAITDTYAYNAYGQLIDQTGTTANDYLFTGEQFDAALNNYYLRARYYDPVSGRFTQMDDWEGIEKRPASLHKYTYVENDPLNNIDPTGHFLIATSIGSNIRGILAKASLIAPRINFRLLISAGGHLIGIAATTCVAEYVAAKFGILMPASAFNNACQGGHRGRWQAQGGGLNIPGEGWAQGHPLTLTEGLRLLDKLENKLSPKDRRARASGFLQARAFATRAASVGGVTVTRGRISETFPRGHTIRVDLEVIAGTAFILQ